MKTVFVYTPEGELTLDPDLIDQGLEGRSKTLLVWRDGLFEAGEQVVLVADQGAQGVDEPGRHDLQRRHALFQFDAVSSHLQILSCAPSADRESRPASSLSPDEDWASRDFLSVGEAV